MQPIELFNEKNNGQTVPSTSETGAKGEKLAALHLVSNGYTLVAGNFKVPVGRNSVGAQVTGEIDLIALDGDTLCFVEVKTRRSAKFADPLSNVDLRKQRQITRTARIYRRVFGVYDMPYRFDVISVLLEKGVPPKIELIRAFWNESKFKKQDWSGDIW